MCKTKLEKFKLGNIPNCYYIPNYITKEEESILSNNIYSQNKWTVLKNRRLQNHGGIPHEKGMLQQDLPKWLDAHSKKIKEDFDFFSKSPNHVLINEYTINQGIMAHKDGPIYEPFVACISILSTVLITFKNENLENLFSVLLEPRSLIIFTEEVYQNYLHCILENKEFDLKQEDNILNLNHTNYKLGDIIHRDTRISLTFRNVKKTFKKNFLKL